MNCKASPFLDYFSYIQPTASVEVIKDNPEEGQKKVGEKKIRAVKDYEKRINALDKDIKGELNFYRRKLNPEKLHKMIKEAKEKKAKEKNCERKTKKNAKRQEGFKKKDRKEES